MGHNIHHSTYPENVNKKAVQAEWDEYAMHEDWQEGCSGLNADIRWIDYICQSYEEAEEYIEQHDKGWYDQLAVKYKDFPELTKSKTYEILEERANRLQKRYIELRDKIHYQGCKSEFISCKSCGSKLASKYFNTRLNNTCPVCLADLRPKSTLDAISVAKKNAEKANADLKAELKKMKIKQDKKAKIRWLVKIEYHT